MTGFVRASGVVAMIAPLPTFETSESPINFIDITVAFTLSELDRLNGEAFKLTIGIEQVLVLIIS